MNTQADALSEHSQAVKHCGEIFIVDDDESMRDTLELILSLEGFPVTCFADGETFLKQAGARIPVCIFLDVIMPGRSGLQILKELRTQHSETPIFLISAQDDTPTVVEGLKSGAHDFLRKPFDPYTAVQRVRDAVDLWNCRNEKRNTLELETMEFPGRVRLTRREAEVLAQIIRDVCSKDTAKSLGIGKRSVDTIRRNIIKKLGARNTADLTDRIADVLCPTSALVRQI